MPDRTECPRCQKVGFVRVEHVIKATISKRHCYCGACDHSWTLTEDGEERRNHANPPERSHTADRR